MASTVRQTALRPVVALTRGAADRQGRFSDPSLIRAERDSLAAFLVGQADLAAENRELRGLLGMRPRLPYTFVPAEITRLRGTASEGTFLLSVGEAQGVRQGAPIVTGQGLVGMVRTVDRNSSMGIDWTHPEFRASVVALDGETYGLLAPRTINGEPFLSLSATALHTNPKPGTVIVTSGAGMNFPRGVPIGTIIRDLKEAGTWQKTYLVRPYVSGSEMGHVLVLGERRAATTDQDLAAVWGIRLQDAVVPDSVLLPVAEPQAARPAAARVQTAAPAPRAPARPRGPRLLGRPVTGSPSTPAPNGQ